MSPRSRRRVLHGIVRNERRILVGWDAVVIAAVQRLAPVLHRDVVAWFTQRRSG